MGSASSIALGIALAQPSRKVIVMDGDGSLLMQLGSLVTIAGAAPENLYHFVFENGVYATSGGQPLPAEGRLDFEMMARGAASRTRRASTMPPRSRRRCQGCSNDAARSS